MADSIKLTELPGVYVKTKRGTVLRLFQGKGYVVEQGRNDSASSYFLTLVEAAYTPDKFSTNPRSFQSVLAVPDKDAWAANNLLPKLEIGSRILYKSRPKRARKDAIN